MGIHFRPTPLLAVIGVLALGGASTARAQDTSAAARADTSGYQPYQNRTDTMQVGKDTTRTDTSGFQYTGPPTDTTLKADTGAQTGPAATDTMQVGKDTTRTDTSGFQYTGPPTDTTLKADTGAQTGPAATDSGAAAAPSGISASDSVVCKDGSNEGNRGGVSCGSHGGIDSVATTAAMKARGWLGKSDSSAAKDTSSSSQKQSP